MRVTSSPSETSIGFDDPELDALYEAEIWRRESNRRFWDGFSMVAIVVFLLLLNQVGDVDYRSTMLVMIWMLGSSVAVKLHNRSRAYKHYERIRTAWAEKASNDPSWRP